MRQDFDYVTFKDYQADMAEVGQNARNIIEMQREQIESLEFLVWLLVMAAGGEIRVPHNLLMSADKGLAVREWMEDPATMDMVYRAFEKK